MNEQLYKIKAISKHQPASGSGAIRTLTCCYVARLLWVTSHIYSKATEYE